MKILLFLILLFPVVTVAEGKGIDSSNGRVVTGTASWYSTEACKYNPHKACPTASGKSLYELERTKKDFAASWVYPMGQKLKVTNQSNGRCVVVTVLDRGPARRLGRAIDLSKSAFSKISSLRNGIINVKVEVLP